MMQLSRVHVVGGGGDKGNKGVTVGSACSVVCGAIWLTPTTKLKTPQILVANQQPGNEPHNVLQRRSSFSSGGGAMAATATTGTGTASPCGACKLLRRKCASGCIFAPHFGSDQAARFAAVHKVFGASNVSKLLHHIPVNRRHEAVVTISYEAQARLSDPVYGCVSTILALQQQVASLQGELSLVQSQLINSRVAMATTTAPPTATIVVMQQPEYSLKRSSTSTTLAGATMNSFPATAAAANGYDVMAPANLEHSLQPMPRHQQVTRNQHEDDWMRKRAVLIFRWLLVRRVFTG
ncbi:unnamed protein product, partial [Brassica rapa subsp. narinosa]